ncbi:hypothetical protein ACFLTM_04725 [Candidatus Bipolaricaulota bacterium]
MRSSLGSLLLVFGLVSVGLFLYGCSGGDREPSPAAQEQQVDLAGPAPGDSSQVSDNQPIDEPEPVEPQGHVEHAPGGDSTPSDAQPDEEPEPVNYLPVADISYEPSRVAEGDVITFTDVSTDKNDDIVARRWVLNGVEVSTEKTFEWIAEAGPVTVILYVTDSGENTQRDTESLQVAPRP